MRLLLDTNVVSAVMHRTPDALTRLRRNDPAEVVLSSPVAAEIHYGLARLAAGSRRRSLLEGEFLRLRQVVQWADWTEGAAAEFGRQKAILERLGTPIDDMDIAIASIALDVGASVATYDVRHFARLAGLEIDDWTAA